MGERAHVHLRASACSRIGFKQCLALLSPDAQEIPGTLVKLQETEGSNFLQSTALLHFCRSALATGRPTSAE
eukprot:15460463-Alexandrium_andersonii.AAC.1